MSVPTELLKAIGCGSWIQSDIILRENFFFSSTKKNNNKRAFKYNQMQIKIQEEMS